MKIHNISLMNYRNYDELNIVLGDNVNVFLDEISREEMAAYVEMHSPVAVFRLV